MAEKQGERIKLLRKHLGVNQEDFAKAIGLSGNSAVSQFEKGVTTPNDRTLAAIATKFGVNYEWLLNGSGEMLVPKEPESKVNVYARVEEIIERMLLDHAAEKRELYDIIKHDREIQKSLIEQLKKVK